MTTELEEAIKTLTKVKVEIMRLNVLKNSLENTVERLINNEEVSDEPECTVVDPEV